MNTKNIWSSFVALTAAAFMVGCGSGEDEITIEPIDTGTVEAMAPTQAKKKKKSYSLVGKIDAALDRGDYQSATDSVLKGNSEDPAEARENMLRVQDAIADGMAIGDPAAIKAWNTMNQVRLMRQSGGR
jgi:hypothetical protein